MKHLKILLSFLAWLVVAGMVAAPLQAHFGIHPVITMVSLATLTLFCTWLDHVAPSRKVDAFRCDITVDVNVWAREIIKYLMKNNAFMGYSMNESDKVHAGKVVIIPQPGARPTVVKNRSAFPASVTRRSDTVISYELDEYSTNPAHVVLNELSNISYDKMQSVIRDLYGFLLQDVADDLLVKWAMDLPGAKVVYTSGPATAAVESGQTGNRLAMIWQNLQSAMVKMDKDNVPDEGRFAVIESNMYAQLFESLANTPYKDFSRYQDPLKGTVGNLFKFNIIQRSNTPLAATDFDAGLLAVNDFDAVTGATDDVLAICYHQDCVTRAVGEINLFSRENDPLYFGDIKSTSMRAGGRVRRSDNSGIVVIKQKSA